MVRLGDKCQFFQPNIKYLGHVIDKVGLNKDPDKLKCISVIKQPCNITELKSFLGLINYYGKFVKNLAIILSPLHELLKKIRNFVWTRECNKAFLKVKEVLMSNQLLTHFNPELSIVLSCDASDRALELLYLTDLKIILSDQSVLLRAHCLCPSETIQLHIRKL